MSKSPGYHGCYLRVDLSRDHCERIEIDPRVLRRFIGGSGLGTWLLTRETPRSEPLDALHPDMPVVIAFSPLIGTPLTTSAKFAMLAKSPLTHRINDSLLSSHFAIAGKKCGCDAIVIVGRANAPAVLAIDDGEARLVDARRFAGLTAAETESRVRDELGRSFQVASIGPAGEREIPFATVSHDGRHAGRGGMGAVFGSKHLKAIAVRGTRLTTVADADGLVDYARGLSKASLGPATAKYRELGTVSNLVTFNRLGSLPTRNFQQSTFAGAEALALEHAGDMLPRVRSSCAACTIGCEHIFSRSGDDSSGVRMEYESLFALGPLCEVNDRDAVLRAARLCDDAGVDTISSGGAVAFGMECVERGLLDEPWLRFGSGEALVRCLSLIARREGVGALLSQGVRVAAERIGPEAQSFAMHVKGLELPGYEPRSLQTMALGFAVGTRGADHNRSGAYQVDFSEETNRLAPDAAAVHRAIETENEAAVMDSLILCKFLRGVFDDRMAAMAEMLRLVTGFNVDSRELIETAGRIVNAKKRYNILQGWTPDEDRLPSRVYEQPLPDGVAAGARVTEERMTMLVRQYNTSRGWSPDGWLADDVTDAAQQ
ncbi:MAG: aldehyde ferredoxin oxidoreductase C-terminal domain-containing protein [Planctomycetaceae bacterium]